MIDETCRMAENRLTLVLNAAEGALQIGLADHERRLLYACVIDAPSRGAEVLTPALESAFSLIGASVRDVARVAVVKGPGSFTGIRLAATTAAGLARAVGARQAGLDYMHCLARECLPFLKPAPPGTQLWILVRARRDLVYARPLVCDKDGETPLRALADLAVLPVASGGTSGHILDTALLHKAPRILLAGSGARENRDALLTSLGGAADLRLTFLSTVTPRPDTLLDAAFEASYGHADIEPLYVRPSDAEANLPQIAGRLGLNPGKAAEELHRLTHTQPGDDQES